MRAFTREIRARAFVRLVVLGALLCSAPLALAAQRSALTPILPASELDAMIDALPPVGTEGIYDASTRTWIWQLPVARLRAHIEAGGTLTDEQWQRALERSHALASRARWPIAKPFAVTMAVPAWLPGVAEIRAAAPYEEWKAARVGPDESDGCGNCAMAQRDREAYQELGMLSLGRHELVFRTTVDRLDGAWHFTADPVSKQTFITGEPLWKGSLRLAVEGVPSETDAALPVRGVGIDRLVRATMRARLTEDGHALTLDIDRARVCELDSTALLLDVELLEDGRSAREPWEYSSPSRFSLSIVPQPFSMGWSLTGDRELSHWSLRLRGKPRDVLRTWCDSYWDGEIVIPLSELR